MLIQKNHLKSCLDILVQLKEQGILKTPEYNYKSLDSIIVQEFANLGIYGTDVELLCVQILHDWEKFSGDIWYPVPSTDTQLSAEDMFYQESFWVDTEYGKLNFEALDFIIEKLKSLVESNNDVHIYW